jgi:hypothetical protein
MRKYKIVFFLLQKKSIFEQGRKLVVTLKQALNKEKSRGQSKIE